MLLGILVQPDQAMAWGDQGHRIIARIAAERLTDAARAEVEELLDGPAADAMAKASTWADEIKGQRPETRPWHYVNIPITDLTYKPELCPNDDCIVAQIEREIRIVGDQRLLKPVRAEALRFLIHFMGDLHQPLHCGDKGDRGGNEVKVRINGRDTNLHAVWDVDLVRDLGDDEVRLAQGISSSIRPRDAALYAPGTVAQWCVESATVADQRVYGGLEVRELTGSPILLPPEYLGDVANTVRSQFEKAGVRLATILNKALR